MPGIITTSHEDTGLPAYEDGTGEIRMLAKLPPKEEERRKMRSASAVMKLIPRSQWRNIDLRSRWANERFNVNQRSTSGCVGFSAVLALMRKRDLAGMAYAKLSGSYVYSWINGNRDAGAMISDALGVLKRYGTCLESTCPVSSIFRNQTKVGDVEAQRFRLSEGFTINDGEQGSAFDWICSALQTPGMLVPQFAIEVGNNFESFDANGVAGFSRGYGNHSVIADGMIEINGRWYLLNPQSWNPAFGPFRSGTCLLSEDHVMGVVQAGGQDSFIFLDETSDPQDASNPQLPASSVA